MSALALVTTFARNRLERAGAHVAAPTSAAVAAPCEAAEGPTCAVPTGAAVSAVAMALPPGTARLVELTSEHCAACARMAPVMARLERACASKPATIVRVSVDDDHGRGVAEHYGVRALPTFMVVDTDGSEVERFVGEQPEAKLALAVENLRGEACVER